MHIKRTPKTLALVAVAIVLMVGVFWAISGKNAGGNSKGIDEASSNTTAGVRGGSVGGTYQVSLLDASDIEHLATQAASQMHVSPSQRESLQNAIADTLGVYASGTFEEWLLYLDSYGIPRPEIAASNPQYASRLWGMSQKFFSTMRLGRASVDSGKQSPDADGAQVDAIGGGAEADMPDPRIVFRRARGRDSVGSVTPTDQSVARITVPGSFLSINDDEFEGEFQIEFTRDPQTDAWVVTEFSVVAPTSNTMPGVPPIAL